MKETRVPMDEILLSPDDIELERKKAHKAWLPESGTIPWRDFWETWKLRAQVAKLVEWQWENRFDSEGRPLFLHNLATLKQLVATLHAAAGMVSNDVGVVPEGHDDTNGTCDVAAGMEGGE